MKTKVFIDAENVSVSNFERVGTGVAALFEEALRTGAKIGKIIKNDNRWTLTDEGRAYAPNLEESIVWEEKNIVEQQTEIKRASSKAKTIDNDTTPASIKCAYDNITDCNDDCRFYNTCNRKKKLVLLQQRSQKCVSI